MYYKTKLQTAIIAIFMIYLISCGLQKSSFTFPDLKLEEQLMVVDKLTELRDHGFKMISCGNNFELEYLLPTSENFINCRELSEESQLQNTVLVSYFPYPVDQNNKFWKLGMMPITADFCLIQHG